MATRKERGKAGDKTIRLPISNDIDYGQLVEDREAYRRYLDRQIADHPELFPEAIERGYRFHGWVESSRQHVKTRRIYLPLVLADFVESLKALLEKALPELGSVLETHKCMLMSSKSRLKASIES